MEVFHEKRKFPRFLVTNPVVCFRYGRRMTMRTLDISLGGLKLEAKFDLEVGESVDLTIIAHGTEIHCKGKILAVEEFGDKVRARLCFTPPLDWEYEKVSDYLDTLPHGRRIPLQKWVIVGLFILMAFIAYLLIRIYF
jgi:hypothetical protein